MDNAQKKKILIIEDDPAQGCARLDELARFAGSR